MNPLAIVLVALALVPIGACVLARTAAHATAPNAKQSPFNCDQGASHRRSASDISIPTTITDRGLFWPA
jgi:hypothetical protein